jgi:hypothetical protein
MTALTIKQLDKLVEEGFDAEDQLIMAIKEGDSEKIALASKHLHNLQETYQFHTSK